MPRRFFRLLAAAASAGDHVPDADLLRQFAHDQNSAAFELLVRRHADAVWTACRRVLRSEADAEDAFQATFLILARKAGSIRGTCVGGWLHRVAINAALKLRATAARAPVAWSEHLDAIPAPTDPDRESAGAVQEELARLPDRYRLPVVLCDLEGHTHAEAAATLCWPVGSVSGRLSRARVLLRDRLTRRGLAPVVVLTASAAPAGAVRAASTLPIGGAAVHPVVLSLTEGVLSAMRLAKLKLTTAVVVSAGLLGLAGTGTVLAWPQNGEPGEPQPERPTAVAPVDPERPQGKANNPFSRVFSTAFPDIKAPDLTDLTALPTRCPRLGGGHSDLAEATDDTYRQLLKAQLRRGGLEISKFQARLEIGAFQSLEFNNYYHCLDQMQSIVTELWASDSKTLTLWLEEFVVMGKVLERVAEARVRNGVDQPQQLDMAVRYRAKFEAALWKAKNPKVGGR